MHHELLHREEGFVSDIWILMPEKLHDALLAAELFDYAEEKHNTVELNCRRQSRGGGVWINVLFATRVMAHVFAYVEASHAEDERVFNRLQQMHQDSQELVILLVEATGVLAPELAGLVNGRPLQAAGLHLRRVLVERAQILHGCLQLVVEELDVVGDVLVVELALAEYGELLQHLALHHGDAVLLGDLAVLHFLDQVLQLCVARETKVLNAR